MKKVWWLGWVVVLLSCGTAGALETMAYRFAVEPDCIENMRWEEKVPKVAEPPKSCFIGKGDELVDLCQSRALHLTSN